MEPFMAIARITWLLLNMFFRGSSFLPILDLTGWIFIYKSTREKENKCLNFFSFGYLRLLIHIQIYIYIYKRMFKTSCNQ
ncbi:hypothetical protein F4703DRAFT_1828049 [Phycomyces blakesleeanus]